MGRPGLSRPLATLLILTALTPAPAAGDHVPLEYPFELFRDETDDVEASGPNLVGAHEATDVRRLYIASETEQELVFVLEVGALALAKEQQSVPSQWTVGYVQHFLNFTLTGTNVTYGYELSLTLVEDLQQPGAVAITYVTGSLCLYWGSGECRFQSTPDPILDADRELVKLPVRKAALAGAAGFGSFKLDLPVRKGSDLSAFEVDSLYYSYYEGGARDEAVAGPNTHYHLASNPDSTVLLLRIAAGEFSVPLQAGFNQSVTFMVGNLMEAKRLIYLDYEVRGPDEAVKGFVVTGPASLSLPAGQWRNYSLAIQTPAEISTLYYAELIIRATTRETSDVGFARTYLFPALSLGPEQNTLYLHSYPPYEGPPPFGTYYELQCDVYNSCGRGFLSERRDDPHAVDTERLTSNIMDEAASPYVLAGSHLAALPLLLDPAGKVHFEFKIGGSPAGIENVRLMVDLRASARSLSNGLLASVDEEVSLTRDGEVFTFDITPRRLAEGYVPAPASLTLIFRFLMTDSTVATAHNLAQEVWFDPAQSFVRLPLLPLPDELLNRPTPSPFQISVLGEREEFVQPGKGRLFNASVTNIDAQDQRVRLEATSNQPGWPIAVLPAEDFELSSGASVTLGLLVRVPETAAEGQRADIVLSALGDDGSRRAQKFTLTVTGSADASDDTGAFVGDPEDLALISKAPTDTPGPTLLLCVAALMAVLALRGRDRRRRPPKGLSA